MQVKITSGQQWSQSRDWMVTEHFSSANLSPQTKPLCFSHTSHASWSQQAASAAGLQWTPSAGQAVLLPCSEAEAAHTSCPPSTALHLSQGRSRLDVALAAAFLVHSTLLPQMCISIAWEITAGFKKATSSRLNLCFSTPHAYKFLV